MSANGKNGVTPAYEDKVQVANKITFFARQERERTILLKPFVGSEGREKDVKIIEFAERLQNMPGETEILKLKNMALDKEFYDLVAMALDMDDPAGREWLEKNMNLLGWFDAFKAAVDYRMAGSVWRADVQEALGK